MQPQNTPTAKQQTKTPSTKASISGGIFSLLALASAGIAHFFAHADSRTHTEVTTAVGKVDSGPVADVASKSVSAILTFPFVVGAVIFGLIAIIFTLIRLRKVKVGGLVLSLLWVVLSIWAIVVASNALAVFRAHPSS